MGLFSRKKTRETPLPSPPGPSPSGRSTSAPATATLAFPDAPGESSIPSPTDSAVSNFSRAPKPPRAAASPRFGNPFRTASSPPVAPAGRASTSHSLVGGDRAGNSSQGSWDDAGVPLAGRGGEVDNSPNLAPLDRYKVFGGKASSSTVSLPMLSVGRDETTPRMRQTSAMASPVEEQESHQHERGMFSRFKIGRPAKQRQGSVSSFRMFDGAGLGIGGSGGSANDEDNGFSVVSFRTVSRVHEDPVARQQQAFNSPASPPLPALPLSALHDEEASQEQLRTSMDYSTTSSSSRNAYPRRPSLNTLGGSSPSSHAWERAPSPTITADAFRLASARSKSSLSLASMSRDDLSSSLAGSSSAVATEQPSRPRFEPQRPASRTSRRGSTYSDAGSPSILQPPRPSFAVGKQRNDSRESMHSRASSSTSIASFMLAGGSGGSSPAQQQQVGASAGMANSESLASVASYKTAPTGFPSRVASPTSTQTLSSASASVARPAPAKRMSSGDSELRLIAAYGDSITSSPPCTSPIDLPSPPLASSSSSRYDFSSSPSISSQLPSARRSSTSPSTPTANRLSSAPSVAVQPPTPVSLPGFYSPSASTSSSSTTGATTARPKRTSSLAPDAVKSALQSMGVGPGVVVAQQQQRPAVKASTKGKAKVAPAAARGWVDSSDEEEEERLSTSAEEDNADSDSDDDVPLSQIQSRSQTDLSATLRAGMTSSSSMTLAQDAARRASGSHSGAGGEIEVLAEPSSPNASGFALATAPGAGAALGRRGSNRRSMSTLSFSTSLAASQPAAHVASLSASAGPSLPSTVTAASASSLGLPLYQSRSVSNPVVPGMSPYHAATPSSGANTPALSPVPSPTFPSSTALGPSANRAQSSSSSGTGSSSSAPLTPHDMSPAMSDVGLKFPPSSSGSSALGSAAGKPSVKFDLASLASNSEEHRWNRGRRISALSSSSNSNNSSGSVLQPPPPLLGGNMQHHRSTPSLPTFATTRASGGTPTRASFAAGTPGSSLGTTPMHSRAPSTVTAGASTPGTSASIHAHSSLGGEQQSAHERMKARHRAEALQALKIGRDLNNPRGVVPDAEVERLGDESEDDDEPLASLPAKHAAGERGSMLGGGGGGSMMGGMGGMGGMGMDPAMYGLGMGGMPPMQMGMGMGGAYSPLAMAPPGVDPYLYASLPPDQKMSLHQRAHQMMAMMQQAALQARAESVAGSAIGGDGGGSSLNGSGGQHLRGSASMGGLNMMMMQQQQQQQAMMAGGGGLGHHHSPSMQSFAGLGGGGGITDPYGTLPRGARLPPFAPPYAMSQPFFQHPVAAPQSVYGMPAYAGSAIGFGGGGAPASMMGVPTGGVGGRAGGRAASTIGMGGARR
ncbi:hypothetical protein JCM6882_003357 [Rhodosporidiobolus microsporus]